MYTYIVLRIENDIIELVVFNSNDALFYDCQIGVVRYRAVDIILDELSLWSSTITSAVGGA